MVKDFDHERVFVSRSKLRFQLLSHLSEQYFVTCILLRLVQIWSTVLVGLLFPDTTGKKIKIRLFCLCYYFFIMRKSNYQKNEFHWLKLRSDKSIKKVIVSFGTGLIFESPVEVCYVDAIYPASSILLNQDTFIIADRRSQWLRCYTSSIFNALTTDPIVEVFDFDTIQTPFEMRCAKKIRNVYLWRKF